MVDVSEQAWRRAARAEADERQVPSCAVPDATASPSVVDDLFTPSALELEEWLTGPLAVVRDDAPAPPVRGRTLVRATVVAVLLTLLGGGTTALAMDKTVKVTVDGAGRTVHTFSSDVAGALESAGVAAAPRDRVEPAPTTALSDGDHVLVERARPLTLVEGGSERPDATTAGSVGEAVRDMGAEAATAQLSTSPEADVPLRDGVREVVEVRPIEPPEEIIEDPERPRGHREVVERGSPGEQSVVMRVYVQNGVEVRREQVRAGTTVPARPRIVRVGTSNDTSTAPAVRDGSVWDRLAECEAEGNWATNSGNGYYGGLQFNRATWVAYDGDRFAPLPHRASREEQIAVGVKVRDDRGGYGAWPTCARKLGLPR